MKNLNERIAHCRRLANLKQHIVAEKLGIKGSTYSQMEREGNVSAERLFQLAEIFGVSPCYLFSGEEPCKKNIPLDFTPPENNFNEYILKQPEPEFKKDVFVITKKEEKLLTILRNFSKADSDKVMELISQLNRKDKK